MPPSAAALCALEGRRGAALAVLAPRRSHPLHKPSGRDPVFDLLIGIVAREVARESFSILPAVVVHRAIGRTPYAGRLSF